MLTAKQTAEVIGCSVAHVRRLIQGKRIKARTVATPGGGYAYLVESKEAERYRDAPVRGGYPRGVKRHG